MGGPCLKKAEKIKENIAADKRFNPIVINSYYEKVKRIVVGKDKPPQKLKSIKVF